MTTVVFDFDGTLTVKSKNLWRRIWESLGYVTSENSYYRHLYADFLNKRISHADWCKLTYQAFKEGQLSESLFKDLVSNITLKPETRGLLETLHKSGCELHIVSGNIYEAIVQVLGDYASYFKSISANHLVFDNNGQLKEIVGTKYDFEGKAKFIEELCEKHNLKKQEVYFVGNGGNDEWVYLSGCKTICVTPDEDISADDIKKWNVKVENLKKVIDLIG